MSAASLYISVYNVSIITQCFIDIGLKTDQNASLLSIDCTTEQAERYDLMCLCNPVNRCDDLLP